jgi:Xaa-Pro aminopeptidase
VTRTIALGTLTDRELKMSTAVLRGHIALASAVFPHGLNGGNLDYLAHAPLWELGKDYGHGTGHGVGHFLNVHEGPNYIHWTRNGNTGTTPPFEAGMITSCEPGYYESGKFGIRHESLLLCVPYEVDHDDENASEDQSPELLCFEELTMVPFDLDAVDISALSEREKDFLNKYHRQVFDAVSPHLTDEERSWLKNACREI